MVKPEVVAAPPTQWLDLAERGPYSGPMTQSTPAPRLEIPIVSGIAALTQERRAWIVDIWGVMHNGARAFPDAVEACRRFSRQWRHGAAALQCARPFPDVVNHLRQLGVPDDAYDGGVTSGDVTRGIDGGSGGPRVPAHRSGA